MDKFVFNDDSVSRLLDDILTNQESQDQRDQQERTVDGRFLCRFRGCKASFKYDGVKRRTHELSHEPLADSPSQRSSEQSAAEPCNKPTDDVYSYNCALLADGLFFINFLDAVKKGDGVRLMHQYKYMLLYCRADGHASNKYALECLYQSFLVQSLLSPTESERFDWNRSINNQCGKGCNIPHDLEVEHSNRFIKGSAKNVGPNLTDRAVQCICQAESGARSLTGNVNQGLNSIRGSGKHTHSSPENDVDELLRQIQQTNVFTEHPGRSYQHFNDFERDPFKTLNMSSLYQWITQHKKNIIRGNRA